MITFLIGEALWFFFFNIIYLFCDSTGVLTRMTFYAEHLHPWRKWLNLAKFDLCIFQIFWWMMDFIHLNLKQTNKKAVRLGQLLNFRTFMGSTGLYAMYENERLWKKWRTFLTKTVWSPLWVLCLMRTITRMSLYFLDECPLPSIDQKRGFLLYYHIWVQNL